MQISQKTNADFVTGYTLNLCIIHISVVPYNQNIKKRSLNAQDNTKDRKGIQIPKDIQIIGFDDNLASRESNPALTTIHQEASLRAKIAIECLEAILKSSWRLILLVHGASESHCVCLQHIYLNGILWGCIRCLPRKKYSGLLYR